MSKSENVAKTKSKQFAIDVIGVYQHLTDDKKEFILSKQLLRSGTSIGANIAESEFGSSEKDFLNKLYIALKESNETLYWLELLYETGYLDKEQFDSLTIPCLELKRILMASTKTMKDKRMDLN